MTASVDVEVLRSREEHDRIVRQILPYLDDLPRNQRLVLENAMRHPYGITDDSLRRELPLVTGSANSARSALCKKGFLIYSGRQGITESGKNAKIWVINVPPDLRRR